MAESREREFEYKGVQEGNVRSDGVLYPDFGGVYMNLHVY